MEIVWSIVHEHTLDICRVYSQWLSLCCYHGIFILSSKARLPWASFNSWEYILTSSRVWVVNVLSVTLSDGGVQYKIYNGTGQIEAYTPHQRMQSIHGKQVVSQSGPGRDSADALTPRKSFRQVYRLVERYRVRAFNSLKMLCVPVGDVLDGLGTLYKSCFLGCNSQTGGQLIECSSS